MYEIKTKDQDFTLVELLLLWKQAVGLELDDGGRLRDDLTLIPGGRHSPVSFPKGADAEMIYRWFENQHELFSVGLVMQKPIITVTMYVRSVNGGEAWGRGPFPIIAGDNELIRKTVLEHSQQTLIYNVSMIRIKSVSGTPEQDVFSRTYVFDDELDEQGLY